MASDVDLIFGADTKKARAEILKLRKDMSRIIATNKRIEKATNKSSKAQTASFQNIISQGKQAISEQLSVAAAFRVVSGAIGGVIEQTKILNQLKEDASITFDRGQTALLVQGGFKRGGIADIALRQKAFGLANELGTGVGSIQAGFKEFLSSGGTLKQILSGVFDGIARLGAATNDKDLGVLTTGIVSDIRERGTPVSKITGRDVRKAAGTFAEAFKIKTIQSRDLGALSESTSAASAQGIPRELQFALFAVLKGKLGEKGEKTGGRLKIILRELASSTEDDRKLSVLNEIGLSKEDLAGQQPDIVLRKIRDAFKKKGFAEAQKINFGSKIFGGDAGIDVVGLIAAIDEVFVLKEQFKATTQLDAGVQIASTGDIAVKNRIANEKIRAFSIKGESGLTNVSKRELVKAGIQRGIERAQLGEGPAKIILDRFETFAGIDETFTDAGVLATISDLLLTTQFFNSENNEKILTDIKRSFISVQQAAPASKFAEKSTEAIEGVYQIMRTEKSDNRVTNGSEKN